MPLTSSTDTVSSRTEEMLLLEHLGFCPPDREEIRAARRRKFISKFKDGFQKRPTASVNIRRFFPTPLITYSSHTSQSPLGIAGVHGSHLLGNKAWFFLSPTWSIESTADVQALREEAVAHRISRPAHKFIVLTNTQEEAELIRAAGEAAFFLNKNAFVSQDVFRPLPEVKPEFSAVYNAQLRPWKRHELCLGIEKCSFLFYRSGNKGNPAESEQNIFERHAKEAPGHQFLNILAPNGKPVSFARWEVNEHLNNARVGLCLSETEGAMLASIEYLLAGLPVVSTASQGGRSVYFDEAYSIEADADPRSISQAVKALEARNISREFVADKTRELLNNDRDRFRDLMQKILDVENADIALERSWPVMDMSHDYWCKASNPTEIMLNGKYDIIGGFHSKSCPVEEKQPDETNLKASERPLLTVIQMGYNQGDNIERSLKAVLAQTYSPLEIVFSDDCSTDNTFEVMQRVATEYDGPHKIILNKNPTNLGIPGNVNRAVELSNGALLVQANGDDISLPDRVEKLYQAWAEDPENIMLVYSEVFRIDMDDNLIDLPSVTPLVNLRATPAYIAKSNSWIAGVAAAFSPEIFKRFGPIEAPAIVEDHVIPLRAARLGKIVKVNERLVKWRSEGTSWLDSADAKSPHHQYFGRRIREILRAMNNHKSFLKEYEKGLIERKDYCKNISDINIRRGEFIISAASSNLLRLIVGIPLSIALTIIKKDNYYLFEQIKYVSKTLPYYQKLRAYKEHLKENS